MDVLNGFVKKARGVFLLCWMVHYTGVYLKDSGMELIGYFGPGTVFASEIILLLFQLF